MGLALALSFGAAAGVRAPAAAAGQAQEFPAGMQVEIAADGSVASVTPDAALPEAVRASLVKRVSQWRFAVPKWQGQPVRLSKRMGLRLQAVATTSGGYALRVLGQTHAPDPDPRYTFSWPAYPRWVQRKGVGAVLVYAIHFGLDGKVTEARRLYPAGPLDPEGQAFDESSRAALATWSWRPPLVNGTAVACDAAIPMTFIVDGGKPPVDPHLKSYQAGMQQLCPSLDLLTKIEGTLL